MNQERIFTVLREPHITEKVSVQGELANQYAFKVATDATKLEIRAAIESIFSVSVTKVTTANVKGKVRRTVRGMSRRLGTSHGGVAGGSIEDTKNGVTPEGHAVEKLWRAISS